MFPWLWFYAPQFAPQVHLPWSGAVTQDIEPVTTAFFRGIAPASGDAQIERDAFEVASYGRQLGLISDVLLHRAAPGSVDAAQADESLDKLREVHARIEDIKRVRGSAREQRALQALQDLARDDPEAAERVIALARPSTAAATAKPAAKPARGARRSG